MGENSISKSNALYHRVSETSEARKYVKALVDKVDVKKDGKEFFQFTAVFGKDLPAEFQNLPSKVPLLIFEAMSELRARTVRPISRARTVRPISLQKLTRSGSSRSRKKERVSGRKP